MGDDPKRDKQPGFWQKLFYILLAGLVMWAVVWALAYMGASIVDFLSRLGR